MKKSSLLALITALSLMASPFATTTALADDQSDIESQIQSNNEQETSLNKDKEQLMSEKSGIETELIEVMNRISSLQGELDKVLQSIQTKNEEIGEKTKAIEETGNQITATQENIVVKNEQIAQKEKDYQEKEDLLAERVRESYKTNTFTKSVGILLKSHNFTDFINKLKVLQNVIKSDNKVMADINDLKIALVKEKDELETEKANLVTLQNNLEEERVVLDEKRSELKSQEADLESKQSELNALSETKNEKIAQLDSKVSEIETKIGNLVAENTELDQKLQDLKAAEARAEEERAAAARRASAEESNSGSSSSSDSSSSGSSSGTVTESGFMMPTNGVVTSVYGYRIDPVYGGTGFHSGIDLANDYNTPIYAAKSGTVIFAGDGGTYGNAVFIEHADGYVTRYAHMNQILVSVGQTVSQGEQIGLMGSTGKSTGSHLHFEIRIGNRYDSYSVDPAPYIGL